MSNGQIAGYEAAQSLYVLYEDRTDDQTLVANSNFNSPICDNLIMQAALHLGILNRTIIKVVDLTGGAFFEDTDGFIQISRNPI
jgi:hypothetical protein